MLISSMIHAINNGNYSLSNIKKLNDFICLVNMPC